MGYAKVRNNINERYVMNRAVKITLQSLLIPIIYTLFLKLSNIELFGENNSGLLVYLTFVVAGMLDLKTIFITLIISYIAHYVHMKKNLNAFGILDLLGKPKFLEKYYVNIDILFVYIISVFIVFFFRVIINNNVSGDFTLGLENLGYIFVYPLFWSLFNYYIAAFLFNWMAIAKFKSSNNYQKYLDERTKKDKDEL